MLLISTAIVTIAAVPPQKDTQVTSSTGYSTYIVGFNGSPGTLSAADDHVTSLVNSYNGRIIYKYSLINAMAITMPEDKVGELQALQNVKYVEKDQSMHVLLDKAVPQIGGDQVWTAGYTGKGVKVAVIDTGIDGSHPDLNGDKIVAWVDYVSGKTTPYDDHGHGTHVSSTIAGTGAAQNGQYKGVAPEASLMGAKVLGKDGSGSNSNIIKAIDWAVQNKADVISMSLGSSTHSQATDDAINNAIKAGVVVVIAAGNSGSGSNTIACPGDNPNAITVGAVDRNDVIASFSSRGPNRDGTVKPDVTNMGVGLVAAKATGVAASKPVGTYYQAMSGTSMATPMTAGAVALLLSAKPGMTHQQVKDALTKTAKQLGSGTPNNNYGYGRVQVKAALDYVLSGTMPTPTPTPLPTPTPTPGPNPTPTPTPTPTPGSYGVSLMNLFARYNNQVGTSMERFQVVPGTTLTQGVMVSNTGDVADSYTFTVNGIPSEWYRFTGYAGGSLEPDTAASANLYVTPSASAAAGAYTITLTARSNSDSSVMASKTYRLNVAGAATPTPTPRPTSTPTPTPRPTVTPTPGPSPTPTPVPEPGSQFAGTIANGNEYYVFVTPSQAGAVTAKINWQGSQNDLDAFLYSPDGRLVAKSEQHYTTSETLQYNAPAGGFYLLKVKAQRAYSPVAFTGTSSAEVNNAYVKSGTVAPGVPATFTVQADGTKNINARLTWTWMSAPLAISLYDQTGTKVAGASANQGDLMSPFEQINYAPASPGTYTIRLDNTRTGSASNYKLITPYQL